MRECCQLNAEIAFKCVLSFSGLTSSCIKIGNSSKTSSHPTRTIRDLAELLCSFQDLPSHNCCYWARNSADSHGLPTTTRTMSIRSHMFHIFPRGSGNSEELRSLRSSPLQGAKLLTARRGCSVEPAAPYVKGPEHGTHATKTQTQKGSVNIKGPQHVSR